MTDNLAKINAKGCDGTGLTEALARKLFDNPGLHLMAIVELKPGTRHIKADGQHVVDLEITTIEPVVDGQLNGRLDEHVRSVQQALFRNRKLAEDGETLPFDSQGEEPTVEGVLAAGRALVDVDEDGNAELWDGEQDEDDEDEIAQEIDATADLEDDPDEHEDEEAEQPPASVLQFSGKAQS